MKRHPESEARAELFRGTARKAMALDATAYRAAGTKYANKRDLLSGEGTRRYGGRWTPPGSFATVHASLDAKTALAEGLGTQQWYGISIAARLPLTLVAIDCRLQVVLDLTDDKVLAHLDLTRQRLLRCRWRASMEKEREALTQAVGRIAFEQGLEGLVVPSAQARKGRNLIVFPHNLRAGSTLTIQNLEKLPRPRAR